MGEPGELKKMQFMSVDLIIIGKSYFLEKILNFINVGKMYFKESFVTDIKY